MPYFLRITREKDPIEFLSLGELALLCNKNKDSLKKLITRGILPDSNFRTAKTKDRNGNEILGHRLYSKEVLVPKLVPYIKENIKQGKLITIKQKSELITLFEEERDYFTKYKNS